MTKIAHTITIFFSHGRNKLEIPLGYQDNVDTFNLAPGYHKFQSFESVLKLHTIQGPLIIESTLVSDADDDKDEYISPTGNPQ